MPSSSATPDYTVNESESAPLVLVTRTGGAHGSASATLTARAGSAQAGQDFKAVTRTVTFGDGDTSPRLVEVPLLEDQETEPAETFTVSLGHARCAGLGAQRTAPVTIVDDDQGAPSNAPPSAPSGGGGTGGGGSTGGGAPTSAPTPSFTIGGTVDGLQGSGLVLSNFGEPLPVSANGRFTFSGTRSAGQSYEVVVATQPSNPDQVCTVEHGAGTVGSADVGDIAVHCATIATPAGLDRTFGTDGRVSTPVGNGQGQAVVIQPGGGIVTAGWRGTAGIDGRLRAHAPRPERQPRSDVRRPRGSPSPTWAATTTRPRTRRSCPTAASSPSDARTRPGSSNGLRPRALHCPTARRTPASGPAGS